MSNYRIRRADPRNIVIEKRTDPGHHRSKAAESWVIVGYYNNPSALASGLMSLVLGGCTPDQGGDLSQQIENLRQSIDVGIEKILSEIKHGENYKIAEARKGQRGNDYVIE